MRVQFTIRKQSLMTRADVERMGQHISRDGACKGLKREWCSIANRPGCQIQGLSKPLNFTELQVFFFISLGIISV